MQHCGDIVRGVSAEEREGESSGRKERVMVAGGGWKRRLEKVREGNTFGTNLVCLQMKGRGRVAGAKRGSG
jgi:hypothetical protein